MRYRHVQWGATVGPVAVVVVIAVLVMVRSPDQGEPAWVTPVISTVLVVLLVVVALLSRLEVIVREDDVSATFGFGWPQREIQLDDVVAVRQVRNTFWYGFGVRKINNGWMYNVWGLDAVELDLSDGKVFRIGSNEADKLHAAITLAMTT